MKKTLTRSQMRELFQPSRIIWVIVEDKENNRLNFLPVAFNMYCGYTPLTMCFAIHDINYSYDLLKECKKFVIAIPTEPLAEISIKAGTESGRSIDKIDSYNLHTFKIENTDCYGLEECMINIVCENILFEKVSDHALVVGKVETIVFDDNKKGKNLLSVGADLDGYELLIKKGIHRIAVKKSDV